MEELVEDVDERSLPVRSPTAEEQIHQEHRVSHVCIKFFGIVLNLFTSLDLSSDRVAGPGGASVGERLESAPLSNAQMHQMLNSQFNQVLRPRCGISTLCGQSLKKLPNLYGTTFLKSYPA